VPPWGRPAKSQGLTVNQARSSQVDGYRLPVAEIEARLDTALASGLTEAEMKRRLAQYGANEVQDHGGPGRWQILVGQLTGVMTIVLVGAAIVSVVLGDILDHAGHRGHRGSQCRIGRIFGRGMIPLLVVLGVAMRQVDRGDSFAARLEHGQMPGLGANGLERHLVRAERALDRQPVHLLRPCPALGRPQDDRGPAGPWVSVRAVRLDPIPRLPLDVTYLAVVRLERRGEGLMHARRIITLHEMHVVAAAFNASTDVGLDPTIWRPVAEAERGVWKPGSRSRSLRAATPRALRAIDRPRWIDFLPEADELGWAFRGRHPQLQPARIVGERLDACAIRK
jgi:hypothetical protein